MLCEDEDWSDAFTSQGTPRGYWKLGESWNRFSLRALGRNQTYYLDFELLASRTLRQYISVFKAPTWCYFVTAALGKPEHCVLKLLFEVFSKMGWA